MKAKRKVRRAHRAEHAAAKPLARFRDHPAVKAAGAMAEAGDQPPLVALNLLTIGVGFVLRRPAVVWTGVRMLAAHALATGIKAAIKTRFDRTRPHSRLEGKPERAGPGDHDTHDFNSFPSGHTAGAVAVAAVVARDHPHWAGSAYGAAAAIAGVQVPRGAHYVSDVIAGGVVGLLAEKLSTVALDRAAAALRPSPVQRQGLPP